jgi:polyferredoxin
MYAPVLFFVFGHRAWCRYLCPIGALLKVFSIVGLGKVRLMSDECIGCETCNRSCDMQVDVIGELKAYGEVRDLNCIRCLKCTKDCPKGVISFNLNRRVGALSADVATRVEKSSLKRRKPSGFDVAIMVLWIGVIVLMNLTGLRQDAPQEIKVLMGPGLLIIVYVLVQAVYKLRATNESI